MTSPLQALALGVVLLLAGCVNLDAARSQAAQNTAINQGHAADESLPAEARAVAQDNADAWEVQAYLLDPDSEPSPEVRARIDAQQGSAE